MANILIVYASRTGQTEKIARHIGAVIELEGHVARLVNAEREPIPADLARFRAIVVGGPVLMGGYPRAVQRFARDHRELLEKVPSAFFSVGLAIASRTSDGRAQTLQVVESFVRRTGWRPPRVELLAGLLAYSRYNFLLRFYMRHVAAHEGGSTDTSHDTEYTDFTEVERFAREIAKSAETGVGLEQPSPVPAHLAHPLGATPA